MNQDTKLLNQNIFKAKLASSGLTESDARRLGLVYLDDVKKVLIEYSGQAAVKLDYYDITGKKTPFFRLRLLTPPRSFAADAAKPLRYVQPKDTGIAAYFPRIMDWPAILSDTTQALYITEGEFKAACACKNNLPTIGLGGVYSWRSAKAGMAFLPELEDVAWESRHVFIIFDSDAQTNHNVMQALRHLCHELTQRGAIPFITKLPSLPGQLKTGLDDFIVARGAAALGPIFDTAERFTQANELWKLNDRVCFVLNPGFVADLKTGHRMAPMPFAREIFGNLSYTEREDGPRGPRMVKRMTAVEWIKWPYRLEAASITYAPGQPQLHDDKLNMWIGSGIEPAPGDTKPWHDLLAHLFGDDRDAARWFEQWCAYPFAHPGAKLLSAVVMWGVHQGTGKSLLGYTLAYLYGEPNTSEITQDHLRSAYNDWHVNKQLIIGEEITGSDRRADADRIKSMITAKMIRVNEKYIRAYTVPALANFFFTSNHPDAFFLEDTDRRFFVHEVQAAPMPLSFYKTFERWYKSSQGAAALLHHFQHLDFANFDPDGPAFETASKREMIDDNKSDLAAWVLRLKREPRAMLAECGMPEDTELLSTTQLHAMYDPGGLKRVTLSGLGRELKRSLVLRLPTTPIYSGTPYTTSYRFYAIQNDRWWKRNYQIRAAAEHWCARFGDAKKMPPVKPTPPPALPEPKPQSRKAQRGAWHRDKKTTLN